MAGGRESECGRIPSTFVEKVVFGKIDKICWTKPLRGRGYGPLGYER